MAKKYNYGKIVAVLSVAFNDESSNSVQRVILREVVLKGSASSITRVEKKLKEGETLDFDFDVAREKMNQPGNYSLELLPFLQKDNQLKQTGLTVVRCDPNEISVNVTRLVEKLLEVVCVNENRNPVKTTIIDPSQVKMYIPAGWDGSAEVKLTQSEIQQAGLSPITKTPYITSPSGQTTLAATTVMIKTSPEQDTLTDYTITNVRPKYCLSVNLQGKFKVEMENINEVMGPVKIKATPEAKQAYEDMSYQVRVEIDDQDADSQEAVKTKKVTYNFPPEYVRGDKIRLVGQPAVARFKLISVTSPP
ncbi:MAG: hypothetical protein ACYS9Y_06650 [Planctomycetota bacterium]|jgi:hypothetical protein